ncbi:MAG TPA: NTP transferase domain-containing protein [Jatrophihabitans sp.]|nr:NTP transferase domain-containing protein [Jatrophihabitans sp.]
MQEGSGWPLDPDTLGPVELDQAEAEAALTDAAPEDRPLLLGILGRIDEALAEADRLLAEPPESADQWRVLLLAAELHRRRRDLGRAESYQERAWRYALSRDRQATTLQHVGRRWYDSGDLHRAAQHFELALTMRRGFADPASIASTEQALAGVRARLGLDAIVLAGGRGVRLGGQELGAKALIPLAGWPLADHVLLAASGASTRIQVGPRRIALGSPVFCTERPAGAGPVAAIAAALRLVNQPMVAVLAGDLPFIGGALEPLAQCVTVRGRDAGLLVDTGGRSNYLAAVWHTEALRAALARLGTPIGLPVRALYERADIERVPDFDACSADVDTPADRRLAEERISSHSPGRLPASPLAWPRLELHAPS